MSKRMSKAQEEYFNDLAEADRKRRGGFVFGFLTSIFWRFQRSILVLVGIGVALIALSFLGPLLFGWLLGIAILWPVWVFLGFAAWARFRGDRIGRAQYLSRLRTVLVESRDWARKGAIGAAAIGLITAVSNVITDGVGIWRAIDLAVGTTMALSVLVVCGLEMYTRNGAQAQPAREVRQDNQPDHFPSRQVPTQDEAPGPRANRHRLPDPTPAPAAPRQLDAPGPRSAANRKAV